ncbi:SDR family NAD(P)-dependent oxidoreductase [Streptomyces collinus]|uniref:SDR family NAD(P)-dependent oxidoreductase n=1 Tax=Streptomyces collinus TaxID=42684 RepID=UPI00364B6CD7
MSHARPLALVTGASAGIGYELARQLAERGWDLVINAEDDARLERAAQQIRAAGVQVQVVQADLRDTKVGQQSKDDPAQVARQGLDALFAGKDKVVAGSAKTKAQEVANKALPDKAKAAAHRKMAEPGSAGGEESG